MSADRAEWLASAREFARWLGLCELAAMLGLELRDPDRDLWWRCATVALRATEEVLHRQCAVTAAKHFGLLAAQLEQSHGAP